MSCPVYDIQNPTVRLRISNASTEASPLEERPDYIAGYRAGFDAAGPALAPADIVEQQDVDAAACWTNNPDPDARLAEAFAMHRLRGMSQAPRVLGSASPQHDAAIARMVTLVEGYQALYAEACEVLEQQDDVPADVLRSITRGESKLQDRVNAQWPGDSGASPAPVSSNVQTAVVEPYAAFLSRQEAGHRAKLFATKLADNGYALSEALEGELARICDEERADGERCADHEVERLRQIADSKFEAGKLSYREARAAEAELAHVRATGSASLPTYEQLRDWLREYATDAVTFNQYEAEVLVGAAGVLDGAAPCASPAESIIAPPAVIPASPNASVAERVLKCSQCDEEIDGIPAAFDISQWQYPEGLRFCNFYCLEAYDVDNSDDVCTCVELPGALCPVCHAGVGR